MRQIALITMLIGTLVSACAPSAQLVQTAIAKTQAANPTMTFTPLPTNTPTATLQPATETAIAKTAWANFTVIAKTATAKYKSEQATETAIAKTAWANFTVIAKTATARYKSAQATEKAKYIPISNKELVTYPDNHKGEYVVIKGRVFNINGNQELQMFLNGTYDAVYVLMRNTFNDIYEDDFITIYGEVSGENCGTNAYGAEVCQPLIIEAFYQKR